MRINKIFIGDDTYFASRHLISAIVLKNTVDMTGWQAKFIFQDITTDYNSLIATYDETTRRYVVRFQPRYTKEQTANFKKGIQVATLILYDGNGNKYTECTDLKYEVVDFNAANFCDREVLQDTVIYIQERRCSDLSMDSDSISAVVGVSINKKSVVENDVADIAVDGEYNPETNKVASQATVEAARSELLDIAEAIDRELKEEERIRQEADEDLQKQIDTNRENIAGNTEEITGIKSKIPTQATADNKLVDYDTMARAIATADGTFRGSFSSLEALQAYTGEHDENDYAYVEVEDENGNFFYDRYKYVGTQWIYEFRINSFTLTAAQYKALMSGITAEKVAEIDTKQPMLVNQQNMASINGRNLLNGGNINIGYGNFIYDKINHMIIIDGDGIVYDEANHMIIIGG